ncbi:lyase family protein [Pseudoroseicyclus tamaricis]|uniref:3-carboxy-cis,cis-muconate cycloisomerase n=1 Tax=Pseudoroseicyclus tamaricis TaxID=2705421 RepID=A0A6B2JML2_9RHOB|nr:lyase family protein [Pseudoroseicyclus tamaricis]NDV02833.1 3-carboxy-cis,cis-muconate cycloisomerase [Pseudoroseicyclus tamaricis]
MIAAPLGALFADAEVGGLFSAGALTAAMTRVEAALAEAEAEVGVIPAEAGAEIARVLAGLQVDPALLAEGTASAGVPVPALVKALRAALPEAAAEWLHWGATSQDIVDGALVLQFGAALEVLEARLARTIGALKAASERHDELVMAARTRSQVATPVTFGLRAARWAQPLIAEGLALPEVRARMTVQFGGASGAGTAVAPHGPAISAALAARLGLSDGPAWHTDRGAVQALGQWAVRLTAGLGKFAQDLVLMGRTSEASAGEGGGSSTMPQKANPVAAEAVLTLSRLVATLAPALSTPHAEERDGAAWALEWLVLPQMLEATGAALAHAATLAETLRPNAEALRAPLTDGAALAEAASFALAPHMGRAEAQALVKRAARAEEPLVPALRRLTDAPVDWDALVPEAVVPACREAAAAVFARWPG